MSVDELLTAVRLDTKAKLGKSAKAIEDICQPLVFVDKERVEVVHDTVREYLFSNTKDRTSNFRSSSSSSFTFDRGASHEQIATLCLNCLSRSLGGAARKMPQDEILRNDEAFLGESIEFSSMDPGLKATFLRPLDMLLTQVTAYASTNFSEHVHKSALADESEHTQTLINTLFDFFHGPILFWVQRLSERRSLSTLTRTGKNIKFYVDKRLKFPTHLEPHLQDLYVWADDLIHLVTAFGKNLYEEPHIIHTIVPSLCPTESKIYSQLRNSEVGLQVFGFSHTAWPDQISSTSYGRDYANALACCEKAYAVALRSQQIVIYYATTCQEARRFKTSVSNS